MTEKIKKIAMIPARLNASRFPGKLMKDLGGKSVIRRTYEATKSTNLFDAVYVVTDSTTIYDEITAHRGEVLYSETRHHCGSDRIAEAVQKVEADIIVNVQGDEPFTSHQLLADLLKVFDDDGQKEIDLATPMTILNTEKEVANPNNVKVIVDINDFALYFSRSMIPFPREKFVKTPYYKHIGIYAFRKRALLDFSKLPMQALEATEKIECLRFLEYGKRIKMIKTREHNVGIDTPEDLEEARQRLKNN